MRRSVMLALILSVTAMAGVASAQSRPAWITDDQVAFLRQSGVDPDADVRIRGAHHWTWWVKRRLAVGDYHCPVGSIIDISQTTLLVRSPNDSPCGGPSGFEKFLVVHANGQIEPLPSPPRD